MAFIDVIKSLFAGKQRDTGQKDYFNFLEGQVPIFGLFGQNIYSHDLVQNCIDRVATEVSKLEPKHIRTDAYGMRNVVNSNINRLLKYGPNEIMDTGSFLEKIIWLLFLNYNAFIYPTFDAIEANGMINRTYTGLYPLQPMIVEFIQDITGKMFIRLTFRNGEDYTLPYENIIHVRKKFSINASMGGGINGQPDNDAIQKTLDVNDVIIQGLEKAIRESLSIRGIVSIKTMLDDEKQEAERQRFENAIKNNESGIVAMDLKGEYIPIQRDPKVTDKDTLSFVQQKVLNYYGVSMPILTGDYTDTQYEAFFQTTIEPIIMSLGRNFSRVLFSARELAAGNEIVFYQKNLSYLSTASKIELIKVAGDQGLLTINQKLEILGYPPIEGGDVRTQSLNHIDASLANEYQMNQSKNGNGGKNNG
ncbi:phage portal protein [Desulfosporosinus acididurans]|uniref:Phage portal protein n=1 Tax=Desulfosporosinus acididurans TaxID=476652 RepID=A0A0J1FUS1_9FIRM|nr:phage portal protein [Desulfosporosinus acididurans]KLU66748.1 phage portal protein [Desulfosporosinus acididurans]